MTFTYSGNPGASDRDAVRFLIGDTDANDPILQDEEIDYLLADTGSVNGAALSAARSIWAKFARLVDKAVGDLRISYSQRASHYQQLIRQLEQRAAIRKAVPFAGGISKASKDSIRQDSDRVPPRFSRDQFRFPGSLCNDQDK